MKVNFGNSESNAEILKSNREKNLLLNDKAKSFVCKQTSHPSKYGTLCFRMAVLILQHMSEQNMALQKQIDVLAKELNIIA
ncbi:MAG: hypothetical protein MZU97_09295 [Bacillus subtilis]|nr:hypothetical protein [Bacillus subtilis]